MDSAGDVWLTGSNAAGFPIETTVFNTSGAGNFVAELSPDGSALVYSDEFPEGTVGQSIAVDPNGVVHVASLNGLVSAIVPAQPFSSPIFGVMNAAAGQISGRVAPGEVISIFGTGLGPATPVYPTPAGGFFPRSLGGVQVLVDGTAIPLLYVSNSQINAEIPAPLNGMDSAVVQVMNGSRILPGFHVAVDASIYGIFQNPDGSAKAINQDGTPNSASNPAQPGSIVSIWVTGFGDDFFGAVDGAVSTAANNWCAYCQIAVADATETVEYGGAAPGVIDGVVQISFMTPALAQGTQSPIELYFHGAIANLYVSQ